MPRTFNISITVGVFLLINLMISVDGLVKEHNLESNFATGSLASFPILMPKVEFKILEEMSRNIFPISKFALI